MKRVKTERKNTCESDIHLGKVSNHPAKKGNDTISKSKDQVDCTSTQIIFSDKSLSKYYCEKCNYPTSDISNYKRHLNSPRHKKKINGESTIKIYNCECEGCEYSTKYKGNMKKHIERKHTEKDMSKKTRDDIFKEMSKYNGKIKKSKETIKYGKQNGEVIDKEIEEKRLREYVEQHNYLCRLFNSKDIHKKVLVKGNKEDTKVKIEDEPKNKVDNKIEEKNQIEEPKTNQINKNKIDEIIKEINKKIKPIFDLGLDPNDQIFFPKTYEGMFYEQLEELYYQVEDLVTDKNLINEWLEEKNSP
jgi:hypothetical protein